MKTLEIMKNELEKLFSNLDKIEKLEEQKKEILDFKRDKKFYILKSKINKKIIRLKRKSYEIDETFFNSLSD